MLLYVIGAPQAQHLQMVFEVARMAGWLCPPAEAVHVAFGNVLGEDRKMLRSRSGDAVKLIELLDEAIERAAAAVAQKNPDLDAATRADVARMVGIGAVKYADLSTDRIRDYVFDWDRMLAFDGNTAPYLQYAHARICSIFRRAEVDREAVRGTPISLHADQERALAKRLLGYPTAIDETFASYSPHKLANYLFDLAQDFTAFYEHCPVIARRRAGAVQPAGAVRRDRAHAGARARSARHRSPRVDVTARRRGSRRGCCPTRPRSATTVGSRIGDCSIRELAAEFGTPLFVYDEQHMRARCREAVAAFGHGQAIYATKAFLCRAMARLAYDEGMRLDVATEGELHVALAAGVPAIGVRDARQQQERRRAATRDHRAASATSSSTRSTRWTGSTRSSPTAPAPRPTCCCGSRPACTPTRTSSSPPVRTTRSSGSTSPTATPSGRSSGRCGRRRMRLVGLHCHIGSNVFAAASFAKAAEVMARFAAPLGLPELVLGGGLGVPYVATEEAPTITQWGNVVRDACDALGVTAA